MALLTEALLLRSVDFGESDRVVHLLTPSAGRISAIAKGARRSTRRFPGTLDICNHLQVQIERSRRAGALARLEHARLLGTFHGLRVQPARFGLAGYLLELFDRLAPEGGVAADLSRLFSFLLEAFRMIEASSPDHRLRTLLELRSLDALGLRPELLRCVRCRGDLGEASALVFHIADGGPLCGKCRAGASGVIPVHRGTLRALEQALRFDLARLGRLSLAGSALAEAGELVSRFRRFHVAIELRSERVLDSLLTPGPAPAA